jgi:hypothetical protein
MFFPVLIAALSACSTVSTNMDKSVNVSSYKTYAWKEPDVKSDNPIYKGDLVDKAIKDNVQSELAQKGIVENKQNPDLYIVYHTYVEKAQRTYTNNFNSGFYGSTFGYPYSWGGPGYFGYYGFSPSTYGGYWPSTYSTTEETLVLDFIDSHTNKLVWRGSTKDDVSNVSHLEKTLQKDVHAIMKKYPAGNAM